MTIDALRTPDERFSDVPDYPFAPHYVDDLPGYDGLRMHHLDEGPRDAEHTFLCLHGQPTWSFLYRKMIPVFLGAGHRVVAPDLFGFGKSDKPIDEATYTFSFHREALLRFVERLDLRNVTLVCQDWGGILGLTLPMEMPERFARLLVMNTALTVGATPPPAFFAWQELVKNVPDLDLSRLMKASVPGIRDDEAAAYEAPFPDARYKAGVRRFPQLVPISPEMEGAEISRRAADFWQKRWSGPTFMAIGVQDPLLGPNAMEKLRSTLRGCPPAMRIEEGGHFVQEHGEPIARAALAAFGDV